MGVRLASIDPSGPWLDPSVRSSSVKNIFLKLFGDKNQEYDLNVRSSDAASSSDHMEDVFKRRNDGLVKPSVV